MSAPRIADPAQTLERCQARQQEATRYAEDAEANAAAETDETLRRAWLGVARYERRRVSALQAVITRCYRMLGAEPPMR